jgi:hypothetical protein
MTALLFAAGCTTGQMSNNSGPAPSPGGDRAAQANTNAAAPQKTPQPTASPTPPRFEDADVTAAANVIYEYYAAINAGNYRTAYELWSGKGEASRQTFDEFQKGFTDTASVNIEIGKPGDIEGAAGSRYITFPITIAAETKSGAKQNFAGEYVLRRSVVDGATAEQRAWRIYSAKIDRK